MKYRDNEIVIAPTSSAGIALQSGSYTITGFSITDGQDPDGHIYIGLKTTFGSDGKMNFNIGQKSSKPVANWFNNQVAGSQTTFGHSAGDLSFAFLGTLVMVVRDSSSVTHTLTFDNVALAQGALGLSNNWWFGSQSGQYQDRNELLVNDQNNSQPISATFLRGGNRVNVVDVIAIDWTPSVNNNPWPDWMSQLPDDKALNQIMMPGSHDAGMSELHHCVPPIGAGSYTQTQRENIGQQLNSGSRYFDIRVNYDYNELVTYHRSGIWGCNGQPLTDVLDEVVRFLQQYPSELALLKFSHIRDDSKNTKQRIDALLNQDPYSTYLYHNNESTVNLGTVNLGLLRGKMVVLYDYSEGIDTDTGRFRYKDDDPSNPPSGYNLAVYDQYSNTDKYDEMAADQLDKWRQYGGLGQTYLFLLSWTLTSTQGPLSGSIESLAKEANGRLSGVLEQQINGKGWVKPNIVYIDYMNNATARTIIGYNF